MEHASISSCKGLIATKRGRGKTRFCENCKHLCNPDAQDKCNCCLGQLPRYSKNKMQINKFQKVIEALHINENMPAEKLDIPIGVPMNLGYYNYFVPLEFFVTFCKLKNQTKDDRYELFLLNVKNKCKVLSKFGWDTV